MNKYYTSLLQLLLTVNLSYTYLHCKETVLHCTKLYIPSHQISFANKPLHRTKITLHVFVEEKWEEKKGILRSSKDRPMVLFTVSNPNIKKDSEFTQLFSVACPSPCVIHISCNLQRFSIVNF